ncbi:yippee family [Cordyceps militaris]|uniref:Yippee family n=1 Tax=Cordyceps militaris TaxID=73501 RepID=A0A2H4S795_CORMI|nr:yippee family [Cordyceps militaris]
MRNRSPSDATRSSHRISATPPIFPSYLLPSFKFPFLRRFSSTSPSAATTTATSASTTPQPGRLARLAPDTLRCTGCSADLALSSQIVSKGFTGRYGRALLVAPPPAADDQDSAPAALLNIRLGRLENRQLVTGWHVVADISCGTCARKLGWKYVDAKEKSQKYKVGKYILETERVTAYRSWGEDGGGPDSSVVVDGTAYGQRRRPSAHDVTFDSEDEDECDDIFAGTWDARAVAQRRAEMIALARPEE